MASASDTLEINNLMFSDVDLEQENYYAIYFLYNTGVIEGYENEGLSRLQTRAIHQ